MPKNDAHAWADYVHLHSRYQRSVHIERDAGTSEWLKGYLLTPLVRSLFARVVHELDSGGQTRAWSLTGPYGSGKSAFALFLAETLAPVASSDGARKLLKAHDRTLHTDVFGAGGIGSAKSGLVPVLATGERAPLEHILVRALETAAEGFWRGAGRKPSVLKKVRSAAQLAHKGEPIATRYVVDLFEEVTQKVHQSGLPGAGLLVVLDEAGKPLEHIAGRATSASDVHLLQELAELANRSGDTPLVFVVLLHQAFDRYAADLPIAQRNEWAKVQGRFADIPFQEAADQTLRLIGAALESDRAIPDAWRARAEKSVEAVARLLREDTEERLALGRLLHAALPLHPLAALRLGALFRSGLAQNERSLFAFLGANEPGGFREFLSESRSSPDLFGLDRLYDYVRATFGERLYGRNGRTWAQVESGLARLPADADELDARVLKTVGILGAVTDELTASQATLEAALAVHGGATKAQVLASIDRLTRSSHLVFRRYRNAYQLWDGSDLDLESLVSSALMQVPRAEGLHQRLSKVVPPRPILARRHLMTTGTLRLFEVGYADEHLDQLQLTPPASRADGFIWLVLPSSDDAGDNLRAKLRSSAPFSVLSTDGRPAVIAVPHNASELRAVARDLGALEWVQTNTPELRDDPVARNELDGRVAEAEHLIRVKLEALFNGTAGCDWFFDDRPPFAVGGRQPLTRVLSDICDDVYREAPHIHNELLNRNHLSSAAAAARRALMTAMVESAHLPKMGIEGFPPEYSMYRSLLEVHGIHREADGVWELLAPKSRSRARGSLQGVWRAIQEALGTSAKERLPLTALYERFSRAPYGIKSGVIPVVVLAALIEGSHEIAVYEEGAFVPGIGAPVVERMLRAPERFELQQFRLAGAREVVFAHLAKSLVSGSREEPKSIVPIVRVLVRLVSGLPNFSKNTRTVSARAQAVREALLRAREPGPLLFEKLPQACECKSFGEQKVPRTQVTEFTIRLKEALRELEGAYPALLAKIECILRDAFAAGADDASFRQELATRARRLLPVTADPALKGLLIRASDDTLGQEEWLVSVGTLLGKKPPESWADDDIETASMNAQLLIRRFRSLETLLESEADLPAGTAMIRVAIAELGTAERERVVAVRAADETFFDQFRSRLSELVQSTQAELPSDAIVAALARTARELMDTLGETNPQHNREQHQ